MFKDGISINLLRHTTGKPTSESGDSLLRELLSNLKTSDLKELGLNTDKLEANEGEKKKNKPRTGGFR